MRLLVRPVCGLLLGLVISLAFGHAVAGQIYGPSPYGARIALVPSGQVLPGLDPCAVRAAIYLRG